MKQNLVRGIIAGVCALGALGMSFQSNPKAAEAEKNAKASQGEKDLVITSPKNPKEYGVGTYRIEGLVPKGAKVTLFLDRNDLKTVDSNPEDGSFLEEIEVKTAGKHTLVADYKNKNGERIMRKLEFTAGKEANKIEEANPDEVVAEKHGEKHEETVEEHKAVEAKSHDSKHEEVAAEETKAEPKAEETKVATKSEPNHGKVEVGGAEPVRNIVDKVLPKGHGENPNDPNSASAREANDTRKSHLTKKPSKAPSKAPAKKVGFAISSHTNFNVVKHGVLGIGGKGTPGQKILLLVDNKPAMKGTIKPNGRWKFPVKVATPGFRTITAKNLSTKETKTIKLKIQ